MHAAAEDTVGVVGGVIVTHTNDKSRAYASDVRATFAPVSYS